MNFYSALRCARKSKRANPKPEDLLKAPVSRRKTESSVSYQPNLSSDCCKVPSWISGMWDIGLRKIYSALLSRFTEKRGSSHPRSPEPPRPSPRPFERLFIPYVSADAAARSPERAARAGPAARPQRWDRPARPPLPADAPAPGWAPSCRPVPWPFQVLHCGAGPR